jgi:hypothetical protein
MNKDRIVLEIEKIVENCIAVREEDINKEVTSLAQLVIRDCNALIKKIKHEHLEVINGIS